MRKTTSIRTKASVRRKLAWIGTFLGPGVLAALADNDAGGVISYTVTGAKFGIGLFLPLTLCLVFLTYTVQEMSMRLGVVASEGYLPLVRKNYGRFWMAIQLLALAVQNLITLATEFIGMSAGLVLLGLPLWCAVVLSAFLAIMLSLYGNYASKEKIALCIGALNIAFVLTAIWTKPDLGAVAQSFWTWSVPENERGSLFWYIAALVGNAIAPWMIFYQNGAYLDKGVQSEDIHKGRIDTLVGCIWHVMIAAALILCGAAMFGKIQNVEEADPAILISCLESEFGRIPAVLFGLGLFNAGLLASITVSLSSSWTLAESFGWSKSLDDKIRDAPGFYAIYAGSVLLAAGIVLIPGIPMNHLAVVAQVVGGALMIPILVFLTLLTSQRRILGDFASTAFQKTRNWIAVILLASVSVVTILQALF